MSGLPPPNHPGFQNDIPFPPTWSEVHPESAHLFWRCCEAGRWRRDECGSAAFKGFLFGWLLIFIPVHIGQTPEKSLIAHVIGHFQVAFTVFALGDGNTFSLAVPWSAGTGFPGHSVPFQRLPWWRFSTYPDGGRYGFPHCGPRQPFALPGPD